MSLKQVWWIISTILIEYTHNFSLTAHLKVNYECLHKIVEEQKKDRWDGFDIGRGLLMTEF